MTCAMQNITLGIHTWGTAIILYDLQIITYLEIYRNSKIYFKVLYGGSTYVCSYKCLGKEIKTIKDQLITNISVF